jgi:hypothetical protein
MLEQYKKRRDEATKRNAYALLEVLTKSTQEWTSKLTGVQHWQPENGYDVYVFDPDTFGDVYVLFRRWNEEAKKFDESFQKHATDESNMPLAVNKTKVWVFENWETLKNFKTDNPKNKEEETEPTETTEQKTEETEPEKAAPEEPTLDEAIKEAFEDSTAIQDSKFDNFMDNGVQTDEEREEMWKHPWIRRLASQLNEMNKDYSQFERTLQQSKARRENALQKSLHTLTAKIETLTEKVKTNV